MRADAFPAMGSDVQVYVVGGPAQLLVRARTRIEGLEALWSRFLPGSELSQLNEAAGGEPRLVSPETFELIQRGVQAWRMTSGLFDPTILGDVLRAGYTTSFDQLPSEAAPGSYDSRLTRGAGDIELDVRTRTVCLPQGVGFDPGGIGKGLAADFVVAELLAAGADGVCVNLGGDVRAAGTPPEESWAIAIEHPTLPTPAAVAQLREGAVATSSRLHRRWQTGHGSAHHLIDPQRGAPSDTTLWTATAIAAKGWQAEAFAKAAFLAGPSGLPALERIGVAVLLIDEGGDVVTNRLVSRFIDRSSERPALTEVTA
jgi:thiamine biosynthesis lipoprotein